MFTIIHPKWPNPSPGFYPRPRSNLMPPPPWVDVVVIMTMIKTIMLRINILMRMVFWSGCAWYPNKLSLYWCWGQRELIQRDRHWRKRAKENSSWKNLLRSSSVAACHTWRESRICLKRTYHKKVNYKKNMWKEEASQDDRIYLTWKCEDVEEQIRIGR